MSWQDTQLKHLCVDSGQYGLNVPSDQYATSGTRLLRTSDIDASGALRADDDGIFIDTPPQPRHLLRKGDVLLSRSGTIGRSFLIPESADGYTFAGFLIRFRPKSTAEPRFMHYATQSQPFQDKVHSEAVTSTIQNFNAERYANIKLHVPPLREQRRIADFLDIETARIDKLAGYYQRVRELVSARAQTVIDQEIDQHRRLVPLRYITRFREGPGIMAADFREGGVPLIRIAGLRQGMVTTHGCNFLDPGKVARQWHHFRLRLEDRLISGSATMGEVSVVRDPSVVGAIPYTGLIILRPAQSDVNMDFVETFLRSSLFARQIDVLKTGSTMQHFGPTHLSQIRAPLPPMSAQNLVVYKAQGVRRQATRATNLVSRQLHLLAERRQALITAAVTGQFDVSSASGRGVTEGVPSV